MINGGTASVSGIKYNGNSYAIIELAKGENVENNPTVTIDGSVTTSNLNTPLVYVDIKQIENPNAEELVKITVNASGSIASGDEIAFDENGLLVVTKPRPTPEEPKPSISCAGEKDKNCDGVITCDEEKGEGWTWNNAKGVCEYTGTTGYTVVNTAVK